MTTNHGDAFDVPWVVLGDLSISPRAKGALANSGDDVWSYLARHQAGDTGLVLRGHSTEDSRGEPQRIVSAYTLTNGDEILIVTEVDRSVTTILLPEEY